MFVTYLLSNHLFVFVQTLNMDLQAMQSKRISNQESEKVEQYYAQKDYSKQIIIL